MAQIDQRDLDGADGEVTVCGGPHVIDQVSEGTGRLDPGGSSSDDHEMERPSGDQLGAAVGVLEHLE